MKNHNKEWPPFNPYKKDIAIEFWLAFIGGLALIGLMVLHPTWFGG